MDQAFFVCLRRWGLRLAVSLGVTLVVAFSQRLCNLPFRQRKSLDTSVNIGLPRGAVVRIRGGGGNVQSGLPFRAVVRKSEGRV